MSSRPPKKINELPTANTASNTDYLVINQGNNNTKKISLGDLGFDPNFKYVLEDALIEIEENTISAANSAVASEIFAIQSANSAASALNSSNEAKAQADKAQLSADTAFVNANVYANTSAGLAATTNGQQFQVVDVIETIRYVNNSGVAVEVARYPISNPAVNSRAGKINAWPDPFFRRVQIGKDFLNRTRFWSNTGISIVSGTVFDGNALQRNVSGTANMNGPIIYLDDIGAVPGDTVTLRILATSNGTAMLCAARPRNGVSTIDTQKSFLSDLGSNQPIGSAAPTRMTCTFVIPANTTNIIIYPYSTAASPVINIEAFWAYKGTPSQGPNWPTFGDDEYQNALISSFSSLNYNNLDRLRKFKGKASRRMYYNPESLRIIMTMGGDSWSTNADYLIGPLTKKLKSKLGNGGVGWFGMGATGSAQSQVAGDAENIYYATRIGTWTSNYHNGSTSPNISDSRSSVVGSIYQIRNISGVSRPALSDVKLHYTGTADGVIRWRWNGGAWSANTNVQGSGQQAISLTGFPTIELNKAGANTDNLEIEVVSGSVILCGVDFQSNVPGIVVHKLGSSGSKASDWTTSMASSDWKVGYALLGDVDIHTHLLGVNDDVANVTPSVFKDQMNTITTNVLDAVPGVGVLLMTPPKMPTRAGNDYASVIRQLSNEKFVAFIDLQKVFGVDTAEYEFGSAVPMVRSDNAHPTAEYGTPLLVAEIEDKLI